jgi:hypothetical protein
MRKWIKFAWCWIKNFFVSNTETFTDLKEAKQEVEKAKWQKKWKKDGVVWWDSSTKKTYRRTSPKIGRNAPCPCGAMRKAPCDTSKPCKFKNCCGK